MICLGTLNFGTTLDPNSAFAILDKFIDSGGYAVDTANCYNSWIGTGDESEQTIGAWLRARRSRDRVSLATKVGGRPNGPDLSSIEGLTPKAIRAALVDSLRRLDTDHVEICYAHLQDDAVPLEDVLGAFQELVIEGKTRAVGLSNHTTERIRTAREIAAANGWSPVTHVQQRHSYLRPIPHASFGPQVPLTDDLAEYARNQQNLTLMGYSPLLSGAYCRSDRVFLPHYDNMDAGLRLGALANVSEDLGASLNQVVLAWMLAGNPPVHPVIGVSSLSQLNECLEAEQLVIDAENLERLNPSIRI